MFKCVLQITVLKVKSQIPQVFLEWHLFHIQQEESRKDEKSTFEIIHLCITQTNY